MTPAAGLARCRAWVATRGARDGGGDRGQVAILVVGFVVVAIALVSVVAAATSLHLERTRLAALADLAALDAADTVADAAYYAPVAQPTLSDEDVTAAVGAYLAAHPDGAAGWDAVTVLAASAPDGRTAQVRLAAVVRPAWATWVLAPFTDGVTVEATSSARAW